MSDAVTRLVLVRHGESQSAVDRIIGGHKGNASSRSLGGSAIQHRINEEIDNTGVTEWVHGPSTGWRLLRYNDAAHRTGVDA